MHVRRALLLFAIVLGLAALAASLSRPDEQESTPPPEQTGTTPSETTPRASPREEDETTTEAADSSTTIEMDAADDDTRRLEAGRSASVEVAVPEPGQVTIPDLGFTAAADPLTPARFDVLRKTAGRFPIEFIPAGSGEARAAGTLVVTSQGG